MIRSWKDLQGRTLRATDGEIGGVEDALFDSERWWVRYIVVRSGDWNENRRLILPPAELQGMPGETGDISVALSRAKIAASPLFDMETGLTPEQVQSLHNYYGWPFYWEGGDAPTSIGPSGFLASIPLIELASSIREQTQPSDLNDIGQQTANPRLRRLEEVRGFALRARDGDLGRVDDFLLEDENWRVLYLIVDTGGWLPGRKVIVSPTWAQQVDSNANELRMDLSQETIRRSPEYDPNAPLTRDFETRLYDHYGKNRYWDERGG